MQTGKYTAKATDAKLGYASTGTEQVAVRFEVTDGEAKGEAIVWYGYFSEKARTLTIQSLRHAGWTGDDLGDLSSLGSRECQIDVQPDENGKLRVQWVNAGGVAMKQEMTDEQRREFATRMRGAVKSADEAAKAKASHDRAKANAYVPQSSAFGDSPDDSLPF